MIVISQPRYLPALTYCQRLYFADIFVILDNVQRQKRGFENRNKVLVDGKQKWLTIPSKSSSRAEIKETTVDGVAWVDEHKQKVREYYSEAPFFEESYIDLYYKNAKKIIIKNNYGFTETLICLIKNLSIMFDFNVNLIRASELKSEAAKNAEGSDKLLEISRELEVNTYVSGLNGREYGIAETFRGSGIDVKFHTDRPQIYDQEDIDFVPHLAFFDALFFAGYQWVENQIKKEPNLENT